MNSREDIENSLAGIIGDLIGIAPGQVDRAARFDILGLDSAAIVSVAIDLSEELGMDIDPVDLMEQFTIRGVSAIIASDQPAS